MKNERNESFQMRDEVIKSLMDVVEGYIFPMYDGIEDAHGVGHVRMVIEKSLKIARWLAVEHYVDVDEVMVLFIAAWHDVGRTKDHEHFRAEDNQHEKHSSEMFLADSLMQEMFTPRQMEIMALAIEDHRASNKHEPRSLYGKIVADGDRYLDYKDYWRRTITYKIKHWPDADQEKIFQLAVHHLRDKYGEKGYLKLHLGYAEDMKILQQISERLACSDDELRPDFDRMYDEITA